MKTLAVCLVMLFHSSPPILAMPPLPAQNPKVAILPFGGNGVNQATLDLLSEFLAQELSASGALSIIDRNVVQSTLSQKGQSVTSCFELACARDLGNALGAQKVVLGRANKSGSQYRLEIKTFDIATARETFTESAAAPAEDALFATLANLTGRITEALKQSTGAPPAPPKAEQEQRLPPTPQSTQIQILHQPVKEGNAGEAIRVDAGVQPELGQNQLFLIYRPIGANRWEFVSMSFLRNNEFQAEIPAQSVGATGVEYYIRALDRSSNEIARFPAGNENLSVITQKQPVPATPTASTRSLEKKKGGKKWLWIGVGAAAVGTGAYFATQGKESGEDGTPPVRLPGPPIYP